MSIIFRAGPGLWIGGPVSDSIEERQKSRAMLYRSTFKTADDRWVLLDILQILAWRGILRDDADRARHNAAEEIISRFREGMHLSDPDDLLNMVGYAIGDPEVRAKTPRLSDKPADKRRVPK